MGCRITPDIRQAADCVKDRADRQIDLEVAKAQAQLNAQLKALDRQKENLERQLAELQKNNPLGPLAPVLDNLQKEAILFLADSYVKETRLAIEHYNTSVRELADASAQAR